MKNNRRWNELCLTDENDNGGFQDSSFQSPDFAACNGKIPRTQTTAEKGKRLLGISGCSSSFLKKVDAVAFPQEHMCENHMHTSNTQTLASYKMEREPSNYFRARNLESSDSDVDECSVGSCSVVSNSPIKLSGHVLSSPCADTLSSDAVFGRGDDEEVEFQDNIAVRIHRLELFAYRCTLEALHASGPLNWEQEVLLTNLRISLNISNDEHLMELRNLISAGTSIHVR